MQVATGDIELEGAPLTYLACSGSYIAAVRASQ